MASNKLHIRVLVLAASLTFLGAGCGGNGSDPTSATGAVLAKAGHLEKTTLNVAVLPDVDSAGFFVALHEGLFAQVVMTMSNSPITTLARLKAHVLGVNADANVGYLLVASVLTENGIAMSTRTSANAVMFPRTDIPFTERGQALVSGQIAAAIIAEPQASQMEEKYGAVVIADLNQGATRQFPMEGYTVTKAWAKANPNTLKAFLAALQTGQQIADTDRAAVEAAFESLKPGQGHVDKITAAMMALNTYPLGVDATRLQRVADVMQRFGLLRQHFDIRAMLN